MSGDRYTIQDQHHIHFLTFTVVDWIDVFIRPVYKDIIVSSLNHCIKTKGLECYAWVVMSNHMHLVCRSCAPFRLSDVIRDFKKYTSKKLVHAISTLPESRREWLLHKFRYSAQSTGRAAEYKLWQDGYHGVCLEGGGIRLQQRIEYIHNNPVRQMIVARPEHYLYSSAVDCCGGKGLVHVVVS